MSIRQAFEELSSTAEKIALLPYEWAKELGQNLTGHAGAATDEIEALQSRVSKLEAEYEKLSQADASPKTASTSGQGQAPSGAVNPANPIPVAQAAPQPTPASQSDAGSQGS